MSPSNESLRVLLLENIHPFAHLVFEEAGITVEAIPRALQDDELIDKLSGFQMIGIRSKTQLTRKVIEAAKDKLVAIGAFCIGTNQIDLDAAKEHGIPVFNAPFSNTRSVAELVIAEIVALSRQLGDRSMAAHRGEWQKAAKGANEVRGKTVGIIGYGHIGSQVGVLAEAFGLSVLSHDIRTTLPLGNVRRAAGLDELLAESDFVTLHVPETPQTKNMIGPREIGLMKKGSYLLNLSRGTVVDIPALAGALRSGHLAGAAIDVFPEEPASNNDAFTSELQGLPNVLLTPHIGGSTEEAQANIGREVSTALTALASTGSTAGSVNFPIIDAHPIPGAHRVTNVHRNVPGVLRDINRIVSERNANILAQTLATDPVLGYLVMDLDKEVAADVGADIAALSASLKTRILV